MRLQSLMALLPLSPERIEQGQSLAKNLMESLHMVILVILKAEADLGVCKEAAVSIYTYLD